MTMMMMMMIRFELIKIKLKKRKQFFLLFLGAYKFRVMDLFRKSLLKPTQLLLGRHHGSLTCIPGLEGI
jgi:hypothetical protein